MHISHAWLHKMRSRLLLALAASATLFTTGATLPTETPIPAHSLELADVDIRVPIIIHGYPIIVIPDGDIEDEQSVTVRFVARGNEWANIYLDGRRLFSAYNTRRDYTVRLDPGAYYLEITGVTRFDLWDSGYLDVGRDEANIVVVRYGKETGISVPGNPYAWFPD